MSDEDKEWFDGKFGHLDKEVATIKRGVYGDKDNDVPGLIDKQKDMQEELDIAKADIKDIHDTKRKVLWVGGGGLGVLEAIWHFFKG